MSKVKSLIEPPRRFRYLLPTRSRARALEILEPHRFHNAAVQEAIAYLDLLTPAAVELTLDCPILPCVAVLAMRRCGSLHEGFRNDLLDTPALRRLVHESAGDARVVYQLFDLVDAPIHDFAAAILGARAHPALAL